MSARIHLPSGLVTFLFTDIEGSTRLAQTARPGLPPGAQRAPAGCCAARWPSTDGAELFTEGDSFFVAFPDATAALTACLTAQRALASHDWPTAEAAPAGPDGPAHRLRRAAAPASTPAPRCTGRPGSPPPRTAARCSARRPPPRQRRAAAGRRVPARPGPAPAARLRRPGAAVPARRARPGAAVPPAAHRRRGRAQPADPGHLVRRPAAPSGPSCASWSRTHRLVTVRRRGRRGQDPARRRGWPASWSRTYPDGVWFVDLAAVTDPGLVAFAVAAALGLRPEPGRPDARHPRRLRRRPADAGRARHLRRPAGRLRRADLPAARRRRRRHGCWPPAASRSACPARWSGGSRRCRSSPAADGGSSDAVALLLDRTAAARGGRPAGPAESRRPAAGSCSGWTGCRSRIELAAARLRVLSAGQLADRLDDVLGTLDAGREDPDRRRSSGLDRQPAGHRGPGGGGRGDAAQPGRRAVQRSATERHLTMQATVTWSYRTLGPRAARLLRWLSVFAGPVDLADRGVAARRRPARPARRAGRQVAAAGRAARHGQHLPDARPDPGVRGAAAGRGGRGGGRPGPARRLVPARAASGPTWTPTAGR